MPSRNLDAVFAQSLEYRSIRFYIQDFSQLVIKESKRFSFGAGDKYNTQVHDASASLQLSISFNSIFFFLFQYFFSIL